MKELSAMLFSFGLFVLIIVFVISCNKRMEDSTIEDFGKQKIGDNLYIKKFMIGNDRVYVLIDGEDKLIIGQTSTSYTVKQGKSSHQESNSFFGN